MAESFDDDPFGILAWRGRDRDDLLGAMSALRSGAQPADRADAAVPLADCVDSFFVSPVEIPRRTQHIPGNSLLDQVPAVNLTIRSVNLVELLRPAYRSLNAGSAIE